MLIFSDFIQVYVFTTNHHLNCVPDEIGIVNANLLLFFLHRFKIPLYKIIIILSKQKCNLA